jgi:hypothetical protein
METLQMPPRRPTSYRLSDRAKRLLVMLADQKGLKATAFLEMTLLELGRERLSPEQVTAADRTPAKGKTTKRKRSDR